METNKIFCKLGANNPDELPYTIQGYFICFSKLPNYRVICCNFDESKDFENAVMIDSKYLENIIVGQSKVIKGKVINEGE